ncbi:putative membrane protein YedE/YeeE [Constrictibacter sp. MBR-5]|jgi:uncharacterized membrane protein YedE/YeeE|uniref:YeeE/YedE family protein n=1 Tax=Constrictibacter sp. MBR-5 TaxID=3156467 RepID=UPI003391CF44
MAQEPTSIEAPPRTAPCRASRRWCIERPAGLFATAVGPAAVAGTAIIWSAAIHPDGLVLLLIGMAIGAILLATGFGFAGSWRAWISEGHGAGLRAQFVMLAIATCLFIPSLAAGNPIAGAVAPAGLSVAVGAFLFGLGMQCAGGCASGTLVAVGAGNLRLVVVLIAFVAGAVAGTAHLPWWLSQPSLGEVSLPEAVGPGPAVLLQLAALAALFLLVSLGEGAVCPSWRKVIRIPWPLLAAAVALALLNFATLAVAGHPWSITFGFGLWGAKILATMGADIGSWTFWSWPFPAEALAAPVLADTTTVMNVGIVCGATVVAVWRRRREEPRIRPLSVRTAGTALLGGVLMGYGARLAFGCNIGALFGGIASGSLHGWLWFAAAMAGSMLGVWLSPRHK